MGIEADLRETSDGLLTALNQLSELEAQKRTLVPGSPEFVALSRRIADLSAVVLRGTEHEVDLAETLAEQRASGTTDAEPIDAIAPATRDLQVILDEWRTAERQLGQAAPGSAEAAEAAAAVRHLREEYRVAFETVRARAGD